MQFQTERRIAGIDLPRRKHIVFALPYIYGIGQKVARDICSKANVDPKKRVDDLLVREHLSVGGEVFSLDTPRRLAVLAPDIAAAQPDVTEELPGEVGIIVGGFSTPPDWGGLNSGKAVASGFIVG